MKKLFVALTLLSLSACHDSQRATLQNFSAGMQQYLARRGALCLGKSDWPLDITDGELEAGTRDAVQMPVLERLGLVRSSEASVERKTDDGEVTLPGRRYVLTAEGQRFYVVRSSLGRDGAVATSGDFCPVQLSLDRIASFELEAGAAKHAVVSYTYHAQAPAWLSDPEARRVFPAVDRVLSGAEKAQLKEGFSITPNGWIADDLPRSAAAEPSHKVASQP